MDGYIYRQFDISNSLALIPQWTNLKKIVNIGIKVICYEGSYHITINTKVWSSKWDIHLLIDIFKIKPWNVEGWNPFRSFLLLTIFYRHRKLKKTNLHSESKKHRHEYAYGHGYRTQYTPFWKKSKYKYGRDETKKWFLCVWMRYVYKYYNKKKQIQWKLTLIT